MVALASLVQVQQASIVEVTSQQQTTAGIGVDFWHFLFFKLISLGSVWLWSVKFVPVWNPMPFPLSTFVALPASAVASELALSFSIPLPVFLVGCWASSSASWTRLSNWLPWDCCWRLAGHVLEYVVGEVND